MASTIAEANSQWHTGEREIHSLLKVSHYGNPTYLGLSPSYAYRVANSPLVAFGTLDCEGRPWSTVWGGEAGFSRPISDGILGVRATADDRYDPVLQELFAIEDTEGGGRKIRDGEVVRSHDVRKPMSGLAIDLETRDRVKLAGSFLAGAVSRTEPGVGQVEMAFSVEESLGNCPKYLNKKHITPHIPRARVVTEGKGLPLPKAAVDMVHAADLFFMSSKNPAGLVSMDTNHRGGPPGLMRVLHNDTDSVALVYPEYSGNRLYQSLGNLRSDPKVGIVVPDFATGNVLYVTGRATILMGEKNCGVYLPRTKLAVRIDIDEARFVEDGLPFRGAVMDYSPYNPPLRRTVNEKVPEGVETVRSKLIATAILIDREPITPSISRFLFKLSPGKDSEGHTRRLTAWHPGQHVTLDFASELDMGYSHMRDDDPQSLNDDFVRTFTISAPLDRALVSCDGKILEGTEPMIEITARKHGPATGLLWKWNLRVPLELPVLGFGGSDSFRLPSGSDHPNSESQKTNTVFVAGGIGITPLMAQAKGVLHGGDALRLLWALKAEDLPLALQVIQQSQDLAKKTHLFVTGGLLGHEEQQMISRIQNSGSEVATRRISRADVLGWKQAGDRKFYLCSGPELMNLLLEWTRGEEVAYESFEY